MVKRKRLSYNIQRRMAGVDFIQETKLRDVKQFVVNQIWGDHLVEWSHSDAIGASGGMFTL